MVDEKEKGGMETIISIQTQPLDSQPPNSNDTATNQLEIQNPNKKYERPSNEQAIGEIKKLEQSFEESHKTKQKKKNK